MPENFSDAAPASPLPAPEEVTVSVSLFDVALPGAFDTGERSSER